MSVHETESNTGGGRRRLSPAILAALIVAMTALSCAGGLDFIKKRLPPPRSVEGGYLFLYSSPSAQVVQLCGSWEENNW